MSLQTIISAFRAAAVSSAFAEDNTIFGYDEQINPGRSVPAYPAIQLIPPVVDLKSKEGNYRTTINVFCFKKATDLAHDAGEYVWPELETLIKTWAQYITSQKSLMRLISVKLTYLQKGNTVEDTWAVKAECLVEVQCQSNAI